MKWFGDPVMSDQAIIAGLTTGGGVRKRFQTELYCRFDYMIKAGMRKYNLPADKAASAYSEMIMAAIKNIVNGQFEQRASLENYLYRIYWNKCIDELRNEMVYNKNNRMTVIIDELADYLPDHAADIVKKHLHKENWSLLHERLASLGKKCYEILLLWANAYKDKEIAEIMSYNTAKVARVTRIRCLEKMQSTVTVNPESHD